MVTFRNAVKGYEGGAKRKFCFVKSVTGMHDVKSCLLVWQCQFLRGLGECSIPSTITGIVCSRQWLGTTVEVAVLLVAMSLGVAP